MAGSLQPLDDKFPIVDEFGRPTLYFIRWAQQRQDDITGAISAQQAQALIDEWAVSRTLTAGVGLSGGGTLAADRTFNLANTAVTPGSYTNTNLTVDAQGRITAAANGSSGGGGELFNRTQPDLTTFPTVIKTSALTDAAYVSSDSQLIFRATKGSNFGDDEGLSRLTTLASTTFTANMGILLPPPSGSFISSGMFVRDSTNNKAMLFGTSLGSGSELRFWAARISNVNGTGATWTHTSDTNIAVGVRGPILWIQVVGDGTNIKGYLSLNRVSWFKIIDETFASFLTAPNQIGIGTFFRLAGTNSPRTEFRQDWRWPIVHWDIS